MRSSQPTPLFVIDCCSSDDIQNTIKNPKNSSSNISHSWSLPDCNQTYKDLCGAIHYSFSNRVNTILKRSRSYPNNYLLKYLKLYEKNFHIQSPTASIHCNMNLLDPNGGTQTPGGASSRYSLYGSFFDLSESGYYPSADQRYIKSNNKILTIDGHPLLVVDNAARIPTNNYQDKCADWLRRLNTSST